MSILEQVIHVVAETLNIPPSTITRESSAENTIGWDSLAHVNLMIAIEQTFDIALDVEDFAKLNSIQSITEFIEKNIT
ncbi:MAG: acyl carrier protein [Burkholderiales bacterium]|jgi:acyl carrier protein|nr:acyl carrier protein [Burkholderiales bacterium]